MASQKRWGGVLNATVIISSLGYFVDIYDLILFSIVRVPSLKSIGIPEAELMAKGVVLLNIQMGGMLLGGLLWGMLGDKKGRVSVLYGSILLYSLANIGNAFVSSFASYAVLRLLSGIGLAGELGAAVTLVTELLPISHRGYGVAIVAAIGVLGAIFAAFVSDVFSWQTAYIVGGVMGLVLLAFRLKMKDSALFHKMADQKGVEKGNILMFFTDKKRFVRFLSCIFIGTPNWFTIGVLVAFAPEITKSLSAVDIVLVSKGIGWLYFGLSLGDLASGFISQWAKSRRKVVGLFLIIGIPVKLLYLTLTHETASIYYLLFFLMGISNGYWAVVNTIAAEQFGTNLRATAATTVPNFIRAMIIPLTISVQLLRPSIGLIWAAGAIGALSYILAGVALYFLEETYSKDLNFIEVSDSSTFRS